MIHTMKIRKELGYDQASYILSIMGLSPREITEFIYNDMGNSKSPRVRVQWPGIHEISLSQYTYISKDYGVVTLYYLYVKIEPLTLISRESHIDLFECTENNIRNLQNEFRIFMRDFLQIDDARYVENTIMALQNEFSEYMKYFPRLDNILYRVSQLVEFNTWDADRVDYTKDIVMRNHDAVMTYFNLFKMSALSNKHRKALRTTSIYGDHFSEDTYQFGNKTWEFQIYDKQEQIKSKEDIYRNCASQDIYNSLLEESENVLRFEYRRKSRGTKKNSTKLPSRNIMQFLSEELGDRWFYKCYESTIGFEPFYVLDYHLKLKLAEAFPMTKVEAKREKARKERYDKEIKEGKNLPPYKKQILGKKAQEHWDHMSYISVHNGMQNALNQYDGSESRFKALNKRIRERACVSPVPVPKNWVVQRKNGLGRGMNIPHDFLPNPIERPEK